MPRSNKRDAQGEAEAFLHYLLAVVVPVTFTEEAELDYLPPLGWSSSSRPVQIPSFKLELSGVLARVRNLINEAVDGLIVEAFSPTVTAGA